MPREPDLPPFVVQADIRWLSRAEGGRDPLPREATYRPLAWFGNGAPDFMAGRAAAGGVLLGSAGCIWLTGQGASGVVELLFPYGVVAPHPVAAGVAITLFDGRKSVATGVVLHAESYKAQDGAFTSSR